MAGKEENGGRVTLGNVVAMAITASLAGGGSWIVTELKTSEAIGELRAKVVALQSLVNSNTDDRYRAKDAERDFRLVDFRLDRLEKVVEECKENREEEP